MENAQLVMRHVLNPRTLIFRGLISLAFGILAFIWPVSGMFAIAIFFGAYAFVDGVIALATGFRRGAEHRSWGLPVLEGLMGVAVGIITIFRPGITLLALSILVGAWALVTGAFEIAAAFKLRSAHLAPSRSGRILLGLFGLFSLALGVVVFTFPPAGAIVLLAWVATYALISGILMTALGIRLHTLRKGVEHPPSAQAA